MERIEAVNFALDNDDGARTHYYDKADLILVGVSRCGKTPPACTWPCSSASAPPTTR
jgi:regulator of PEP synthase PpsR (kinase-PPPase family)